MASPADPQRFTRALHSSQLGCQLIGHDFRYLYLNAIAAEHGRTAARDLIGRLMPQAYPGIERTPMFALLQRVMVDRAPGHSSNSFTYADGSSREFDIRVEPVEEGICVYSIDVERALALVRKEPVTDATAAAEAVGFLKRLWRR